MTIQPKVSIIVPVFNLQDYLGRCLDSILAQTMNETEILIIDDGSTDDSGKIADQYAEKDSRITVIHKRNGGLSEARNTGVDAASADYIMFVDSDDWVDPLFCEMPYQAAIRNDADLVYFMHNCIDQKGKVKKSSRLLRMVSFQKRMPCT